VQAQPENSYQLGGAWYFNNGYKNLEMNVWNSKCRTMHGCKDLNGIAIMGIGGQENGV
jgi:hypothetical protein